MHVPYCARKCTYCALGSTDSFTPDELDIYVKAAVREIDAWDENLRRVRTVFVGGGSPSLLGVGGAALFERLGRLAPAEYTVEVNPDQATPEFLRLLTSSGVNRLSLGVQSFAARFLNILGRLHNSDGARRAFGLARAAGFENINVDMMFGLPGESEDDLAFEMDELSRLDPEHVSYYSLTYERGTPLAKTTRPGERVDDETAARMFVVVGRELRRRGWRRYEISNFAKAGRACRHNRMCWRCEPYLGIGPRAVSCDGERRWRNTGDAAARAGRILGGGRPSIRFEPPIDRAGDLMILGLRTAAGVSKKRFKKIVGRDIVAAYPEEIPALVGRGLLRETEKAFRIPERALVYSNAIMREFV